MKVPWAPPDYGKRKRHTKDSKEEKENVVRDHPRKIHNANLGQVEEDAESFERCHWKEIIHPQLQTR